jgi:hypothetical protein
MGHSTNEVGHALTPSFLWHIPKTRFRVCASSELKRSNFFVTLINGCVFFFFSKALCHDFLFFLHIIWIYEIKLKNFPFFSCGRCVILFEHTVCQCESNFVFPPASWQLVYVYHIIHARTHTFLYFCILFFFASLCTRCVNQNNMIWVF